MSATTTDKIAEAKAEIKRLDDEDKAKQHRPPMWWGVLVGLVAAGAGLAVGEFVAAFARDLRSPVVSVGDRVIDRVPAGLKQWAIENFGTSDKTVLIWTILLVIAIVAALAGIATVRGHKEIGLAFAALFGILGAAAGGFGRNTKLIGVLPALAGAFVAGAVLLLGYRLTRPTMVRVRAARGEAGDSETSSDVRAESMVPVYDRRRFLATTGGIALGSMLLASIGRSWQDRFNATLVRAGVRPPEAAEPLPPPPPDPATQIANQGLSPLITPIDKFYRIDTALVFPSVDLGSWNLFVRGMVERNMSFTYDDLMNRDLIERDITISCVSNEVGGNLVGNARWIGCRLDDLLAEAGVESDADQIMGVSIDGFTAGFPVSTLDGRDALIALGMNGEALPVKNGFPARLVVPGIYGYVSAVKWLEEIKLTRFDREQGYWIPRGWARLAPVKTQSRIDRPRRNSPAGATHIAGVAWAPHRGIDKVEVQVDEGDWIAATLGPVLSEDSWVQWWLQWDATPGEHTIRVRATDGTGETQIEERSRVDPDGATGWHTIRVNVDN